MSKESQEAADRSEVDRVCMEIYTQLGGGGFSKMIGMETPIYGMDDKKKAEISAIFRWKAKSKDGLNVMRVTLVLAKDTYRVSFGTVRGDTMNWKGQVFEDVYCEDLHPQFERVTGLITIPPRVIINGVDAATGIRVGPVE